MINYGRTGLGLYKSASLDFLSIQLFVFLYKLVMQVVQADVCRCFLSCRGGRGPALVS